MAARFGSARAVPARVTSLPVPAAKDGAVSLAKPRTAATSMPKITISYRRSDAPSDAGRIFDRLSSRYGKDSVFMDIDTIPFGVDFRDYIDGALRGTDIVLAVIGPRWVGRRGTRARIREETDPVRIEIAAAMRMGKIIVPVLVANAVMPSPSDLPESIANLAFLNAAEVDPGKDFHSNLDRLIRFIDALPVAVPAVLPSADEAEHGTSAPAVSVRIERVSEPPVLNEREDDPMAEKPAVEPIRKAETVAETQFDTISRGVDSSPPPVAGATVRGEANVPDAIHVSSPGSIAEDGRRISGAWWVSMIRGFALFVYAVGVLTVPSHGFWLTGFTIYDIVELTALVAMVRAVRARHAAAVWFLAEAVVLLAVFLADWNSQAAYDAFGIYGIRVFYTSCFVLRALAELSAGLVLARDVRSERVRIVVGALLLVTEGSALVVAGVAGWNALTPAFVVGYGSSAIAFLVLGWRLRREALAAATAENVA